MFRFLGFAGFIAVSAALCAVEGMTFAVERMCSQALLAMSSDDVKVSAKETTYEPWRMQVRISGIEAVWKDGSRLRIPEVRAWTSPLAFLACMPRLNAQFFSPYGSDVLAERAETDGFELALASGVRVSGGKAEALRVSAGRGLMRALDAADPDPGFEGFSQVGVQSLRLGDLRWSGPEGSFQAGALQVLGARGLEIRHAELQDLSASPRSGLPPFAARSAALRGLHVTGELWKACMGRLRPQPASNAALPPQADPLPKALARAGSLFSSLRIEGLAAEPAAGRLETDAIEAGAGENAAWLRVHGMRLPQGMLKSFGLRMPASAGTLEASMRGGFLPLLLCTGGEAEVSAKAVFPGGFETEMLALATLPGMRIRALDMQIRDGGGLAEATAPAARPGAGGIPAMAFSGPSGSLGRTLMRWAGTKQPLRLRLVPRSGLAAPAPGDLWGTAGEWLEARLEDGMAPLRFGTYLAWPQAKPADRPGQILPGTAGPDGGQPEPDGADAEATKPEENGGEGWGVEVLGQEPEEPDRAEGEGRPGMEERDGEEL